MMSLVSNPPPVATINDAIGLLAALADRKAVAEALEQLRELTVEKVAALDETRVLAQAADRDRKYVDDTRAELEAGRAKLVADQKAFNRAGEEQAKHFAAANDAVSQREKAVAEMVETYNRELKINQDAMTSREVACAAREKWIDDEKARLAELRAELEGKLTALKEMVA